MHRPRAANLEVAKCGMKSNLLDVTELLTFGFFL